MANLQDIVNRSEVGAIKPWTKSTAPAGYLLCNGAAVSRSTYSTLFAAVGTTYGAGDGSSTFNVPDLQDKVAVSKSNNKALESTGGANTVTSTGNVGGSTANATLTTAQLAAHQHDVLCGNYDGNNNGYPYKNSGGGPTTIQTYYSTGQGQAHSHNMSANFTGDATSVLQPYLTVTYVIKT